MFLEKFIQDFGSLMELCPDNVKRFPAHISVTVLDNLNGTGVGYASVEENKKAEKRVTYEKFNNDFEKQDAIFRFMGLLDRFRSALYCQTAPSGHWGMPKVVDNIAKDIRDQARAANIATLDASQFWTSIKPFMGPEQLPPVSGVKSEEPPVAGVESEDACETKPDENVVNWHHFETGETD